MSQTNKQISSNNSPKGNSNRGVLWTNLRSAAELYRDFFRRPWPIRASALLLLTGTSLMSIDWWIPLLDKLLDYKLEQPLSGIDAFIQGIILILIGLAFYLITDLLEYYRSNSERISKIEDFNFSNSVSQGVLPLAEPLEPFVEIRSLASVINRSEFMRKRLTSSATQLISDKMRKSINNLCANTREFEAELKRLEAEKTTIKKEDLESLSVKAKLIDEKFFELRNINID
ncbi:MAG: hypothetical protein ABJQ71_01170 [Roseibium sp.]